MVYVVQINQKTYRLDVEADMPLLWALRDFAHLKGTKYGCGKGLCGACTVLLDGQAVRSCAMPVAGVGNRAITTIEGLSPTGHHPLQKSWEACSVPQCGYCQAGQIMTACAFLQENPSPTEEEIKQAMSRNLCRCGTYLRIRKAVKMASEELNAAKP